MARIEGYVDRSTSAPFVKIKVISPTDEEIELPAMIDTGYNGEVILSEERIQTLGLEFLGTIDTELADGEIVELDLFKGRIKWFNKIREIAVGSSRSEDTLLGTLLLVGCELDINFKEGWVRIDQLS
jgi:clan AA aspartic protease